MQSRTVFRALDLVRALHADLPFLPTDTIKKLVAATFQHLEVELLAGHDVKLGQLGTLRVKETKERTKKHPKTGEDLLIPAGRKLQLRSSKKFKERLKAD